MRFPQFWARGRSGNFVAWGWSFSNLGEAETAAQAAARRLAARFESEEFLPSHGTYYPNRPFREQILQEIKIDGNPLPALITRNSYGCQVLNTAQVMFVDIDLPEKKSRGFFGRLFGKKSEGAAPGTQEEALAVIDKWTRTHPDWGWRVYRTRAGLRLMATHALVEAGSAEAAAALRELHADPLYQTLCQNQKCFRARLTPKPWRCGVHSRPAQWPWVDARAEKLFQKWEAQYQSFSFNWATCSFLQHVGAAEIHPAIQPIVKLHDGMTRVDSNLNLA